VLPLRENVAQLSQRVRSTTCSSQHTQQFPAHARHAGGAREQAVQQVDMAIAFAIIRRTAGAPTLEIGMESEKIAQKTVIR